MAELPDIDWVKLLVPGLADWELRAMGRKRRKRKKSNRRALRNHIWFNQHGIAPVVPCHWCRKPLSFNQATVDHEPPMSQGGKRDQAVIACATCNNGRAAWPDPCKYPGPVVSVLA